MQCTHRQLTVPAVAVNAHRVVAGPANTAGSQSSACASTCNTALVTRTAHCPFDCHTDAQHAAMHWVHQRGCTAAAAADHRGVAPHRVQHAHAAVTSVALELTQQRQQHAGTAGYPHRCILCSVLPCHQVHVSFALYAPYHVGLCLAGSLVLPGAYIHHVWPGTCLAAWIARNMVGLQAPDSKDERRAWPNHIVLHPHDPLRSHLRLGSFKTRRHVGAYKVVLTPSLHKAIAASLRLQPRQFLFEPPSSPGHPFTDPNHFNHSAHVCTCLRAAHHEQ
jgi:hypothetical protein